ncbi:MAG: rpiA [Chitinophagaceae bacterium]|nr:rpiA [Chitinophagaceae bacterium]
MPDYKKEAAKAALPFIKKNSLIGFGAGSTIKHLIDFIKEDTALAASITTLTSSFTTKKLLQQHGFNILDPAATYQLDLYFDGCDQFDSHLNALKSGGGIHTMEKLLANMAKEFIILGDESKYVEELNATYPLVIEIIPEAVSFVLYELKEIFSSATATLRISDNKDGAVITEHANYLVDVFFKILPEPEFINSKVSGIAGVLEHSLFYDMADKAVIAGPAGIKIITRPV